MGKITYCKILIIQILKWNLMRANGNSKIEKNIYVSYI